MNVYHCKLYALLHNPQQPTAKDEICGQLACMQNSLEEVGNWWNNQEHNLPVEIANSSDRVNLQPNLNTQSNNGLEIHHPISGQRQYLTNEMLECEDLNIPQEIRTCNEIEKVYLWFWRFYPEIKAQQRLETLLYPANDILPDCPWHSYQTTVSALVGAMYPESWKSGEKQHEHPYLILFTFSPIQEFIKASRKFLDFWAGSYLLHYLGAKVCWFIANKYGAYAVITPSLWQQEIIDALILKQYPDFSSDFGRLSEDRLDPITRFEDKESTSLATAGFPNVITALVPGQDEAKELGQELANFLKQEWKNIALNVRNDIKKTVIKAIELDEDLDALWSEIGDEFKSELYRDELLKWRTGTCWTWNSLWNAQIDNTWETYWTAVPLGVPEKELITFERGEEFGNWEKSQNALCNARNLSDYSKIATPAEKEIYESFNVGTWWGSFQARLGQLIQSVKNTRSWQIPTAPGERSSLSGQYTALHPQHLYRDSFREGGGLPAGSLRLFWRVMSKVYPGLFNGSEMLNGIELTKRMAWRYGGVAESLGIKIKRDEQTDYENLIRFPNLSSIAAARFAYEQPGKVSQYQDKLSFLIKQELSKYREIFNKRTLGRPFHVLNTDRAIALYNRDKDKNDFNGVISNHFKYAINTVRRSRFQKK